MISSIIRSTLLSIIMLTYFSIGFSQTESKKIRRYKTIVVTSDKTKIKGILLEVRDTSLLILTGDQQINMQAVSIQELKFKRTGAGGRGALIGGLAGLAVGIAAGYIDGDESDCQSGVWFCNDTSAEQKAVGLGLIMSAGGALIGAVLGSSSYLEKFEIKGDLNIYKNKLYKYRKYVRASSEMP